MKWLLENGTKLIGLLSFSLVALTTVHEWGYFSIIGPHFRALLTAYDYIANALEWMPIYLLIMMMGLIAAMVVRYLILDRPQIASDVRQRRWRGGNFVLARLMFFMCLVGLVASAFSAFPYSRTNLIAAAVTFLSGVLAFVANNTKFETRSVLVWALAAMLLVSYAYVSGIRQAWSAIRDPANVHKLSLKESRTKSAVLLRTFEKGILIWNVDSQTAELLRWDQVEGMSRVVAFDNNNQACRMLSWFCQPQVEP